MHRRAATGLILAGAVLSLVFSPAAAVTPSLPGGPGPGFFTSDNVQYVSGNPRHTGSSGGRLLDGHFYVTDPRGVYIYDVSDPARPTLLGSVTVLQSGLNAVLSQEDPDTNGKLLLVDAIDQSGGARKVQMLVVDVSDKTAPKVIGAADVTDHTWTCVLDCTYAYGRSGAIVDLTDPTQPKVAGNWKSATRLSPSYTHDFSEVAPGRLVSAGQPSLYLDATDPLKPKLLNRIETKFSQFGYHGAVWPQQGKDPVLLMGTELAPNASLAGSDCQGDGILATYDARAVVAADEYQAAHPDEPRPRAEFTKLDEWRVSGRGTYADGNAPFHTLYCSHWFDAHPDWDGAGFVALAYYDWGTRFLQVDAAGDITQVGWFQPVAGYTASAYWISPDIVYVLDYRRGLDILRFSPPSTG